MVLNLQVIIGVGLLPWVRLVRLYGVFRRWDLDICSCMSALFVFRYGCVSVAVAVGWNTLIVAVFSWYSLIGLF